jgi:hypothetical protein
LHIQHTSAFPTGGTTENFLQVSRNLALLTWHRLTSADLVFDNPISENQLQYQTWGFNMVQLSKHGVLTIKNADFD